MSANCARVCSCMGVRNAVSRCGGSVWESNPPEPPKAPPSGFEGQSGVSASSPSLGKMGDSELYVPLGDPT